MEKKYRKNLYYAHNFKGIAVLGESFETLLGFYSFTKDNNMQVHFCPMSPASQMVSGYKVVTPDQFILLTKILSLHKGESNDLVDKGWNEAIEHITKNIL